jgi:hypothetical protein
MVIAVDGFLKIGDERNGGFAGDERNGFLVGGGDERNGGFAEEEDRMCGGVRERKK